MVAVQTGTGKLTGTLDDEVVVLTLNRPASEPSVLRTARRFAKVSPPPAAAIADTSARVLTMGFAEACDRDAENHVRLVTTAEHRQAVQAPVRAMDRP